MASSPGSGGCVLLIDDNPDLLKLFVDALPHVSPYTVITADDGARGIARYYETSPHPICVVIDMRMPEVSGYQLVRALRGDPASSDTPLVILSALAQDRERYVGLASGADQYLVKPVTPIELADAITHAVKLSAEDRLRRMRALAEADDEELP